VSSPRATYRLQFNEHFRLADALALAPYFQALGISHLYASPLFAARPHSGHGYDVCDFGRLNPELGTEADLEALVRALRERGMGLVVDIVPNHMGIGTPENAWWWDVLKNGRSSRYAGYFDINWESPDPQLRGKVLLPILGDAAHLETCAGTDQEVLLPDGIKVEIVGQASSLPVSSRQEACPTTPLTERSDQFVLRYYENLFPLAPASLAKDFSQAEVNAQPSALAELLRQQHYVLASWRDGDARLNFRRFFAVNSLAAVRVEVPAVFDAVHARLGKWIERGWLDGVRVDHPDGLRDPEIYLRRLRGLVGDLWLVVEKILQPEESLPATWPVQGTTGYEFLNQLNGVFIDGKNEAALSSIYAEFTGEQADAGQMVYAKKRLVLETLFTTEVNRLAGLLAQIESRHTGLPAAGDPQIREAIIELAATFPVYRTFVRPEDGAIGEDDVVWIESALESARARRANVAPEVLEFVAGVLQLKLTGKLENEFVARFQQLTGAVMAKGVEDTMFYCLNRFISLNEVGGDPGRFGVAPEEFHEFCRRQQADWPRMMLASSTHDTKRSEDVRARLNVLSEIPDDWGAAVMRWSKLNERHRRNGFPDRNAEYFFYQTLVGVWPIPVERMQAYMEKASREAKQHTDWNEPNSIYDEALKGFIGATLSDREFIADVGRFLAPLADAAQINSLAQTLIKLTAPGVPDIYQGNEVWEFSLVDPDNRRSVDFESRQRLLGETMNLSAKEVWERRDEGLPKLWLIQKALAVRAAREQTFHESVVGQASSLPATGRLEACPTTSYQPLSARGAKADHVLAFARGGCVITVVPRLLVELKNHWQDTTLPLPPGTWRDELTGKTVDGAISMSEIFGEFPVALLVHCTGEK